MRALSSHLFHGAVAGAAGTTALNAATYLDMALRGRPASTTPEQVVARGAELFGVSLSEQRDRRQARETGWGSLLGVVAGVSTGAVVGALQGSGALRTPAGTAGIAWLLAMLVGNGPMTALGVTDPRRWGAADWAADVVPHLAYAVTTAATLDALGSTARLQR